MKFWRILLKMHCYLILLSVSPPPPPPKHHNSPHLISWLSNLQRNPKVFKQLLHVLKLHESPSSSSDRDYSRRAEQSGLLTRGYNGLQHQTLQGRCQVVSVHLWEILPPEFCDAGELFTIEGSEDGD